MAFRILPYSLRLAKNVFGQKTKNGLYKVFVRPETSKECESSKKCESSKECGPSKECLKMTVKDQLLSCLQEYHCPNIDKVSVVGCGDVGMACIFTFLTQGMCSDLALIDMNPKRMKGELYDLQHGAVHLNARITGSTDWAITAGSKICVITAGVRQKEGESRLQLVQRNTDVLKDIIPNVVKHSPDCIILMVTNPVDILTYVAWKLSGFPKHRVLGSGTSLDTSRFRFFIAKKLGISPQSVHGWIIAEHGDSSVAVWSGLSVAGVRLRDLNPKIGLDNDPECWKNVHQEVIQSAYEVIDLKGYTNWAIGLSTAAVVRSILRNSNKIHPVSTFIQGMCGIKDELYLSMPSTVGSNGVTNIVDLHLSEEERCGLKFSAAQMLEVIKGLKLEGP